MRAGNFHYIGEAMCSPVALPLVAHRQPHDPHASKRSSTSSSRCPAASCPRRFRPRTTPWRCLWWRCTPASASSPPDPGDRARRLLAAHRLHGRVLRGVQCDGRAPRGARAHAHGRDRAPQAGRGRPAARARPAGGRPGGHVPLGRGRRGHRAVRLPQHQRLRVHTGGVHERPARLLGDSRPGGHRLDKRRRQRQVAHGSRAAGSRSTASPTPKARPTGSATSPTRCAAPTAR